MGSRWPTPYYPIFGNDLISFLFPRAFATQRTIHWQIDMWNISQAFQNSPQSHLAGSHRVKDFPIVSLPRLRASLKEGLLPHIGRVGSLTLSLPGDVFSTPNNENAFSLSQDCVLKCKTNSYVLSFCMAAVIFTLLPSFMCSTIVTDLRWRALFMYE